MAVWAPWLADAARMTGYPVVEVGGWPSRGHGGMRLIEGVVAHHTADGPTGDYPSLRIVRDGRAGLAGPLSAYGLARSGTVYVIAAGTSWHAGVSRWAGYVDLNDEFLGIEAESVGTRDDWTAAQRDCYPRLCAAILHYMRRGADRLAGHREVAPGRKIDPAFTDMNAMRDRIGWMLADPRNRIPRGATTPTPTPVAPTLTPARRTPTEDTEMFIKSPEPAAGQAKTDWPRERVSFGLDPADGWGGACYLKAHWGPRGGWIHLARWWVKDADWSPNNPKHHPVDHKIGAGGSERFVGYGWVTPPPADADELEIEFSAPDGLHLFMVYQH